MLPFVLSQAIAEIPGFCWISAAVPMFNRVIRAITVSSALGANFPAVPKDDGLNARPGVILHDCANLQSYNGDCANVKM